MTHQLEVEPLTPEVFAPFGEVIEARPELPHCTINAGFAARFDGLARPDTAADGGHTALSIFRAKPRAVPVQVDLVERHPMGSQCFVPMSGQRFLIVVAPPGPAPTAARLRCFLAKPGQGVNYRKGTWHSPLLAIDAGGDFLVIDRGAPGPDAEADCDEHRLPAGIWIAL